MTVRVGNNIFGYDFVDYIEDVAKNMPEQDSKLVDNKQPHSSVRRSKVKFIHDQTIIQTLYSWVAVENAEHYAYDIYGATCEVQYTVYDESYKGHYDWHSDSVRYSDAISTRKLSISMLLSDSDAYEGGDLEFEGIDLPKDATRSKGNIILFPSDMGHRVTPVTKGTRKSLVAWFSGPRWR